MKRLLLLLLLIPFLGYTQINTFPWTHDFDNGVGLDQSQWTGDDGDWLIWSGYTWSNNTGPQGDHTTGSGNYWYIESSSPNYPSKYFVCQTDTFDISGTPGQILSFWYHMYGGTMGRLNIWLGDDNGWTIVDSIIGDQGDQWHLKYIELDSLGIVGNFTIAFSGITGTSWASDICIDDLYVGDLYTFGCIDPTALNYDPTATVDDGSCTYPPCGGFLNSQSYQMCWGNQAAIQFEWESDTTTPNCDVIGIHVGDENGWSYFYGGNWPAINGWSGFAAAVGNGQMPPNWNVEHYAVLEYVDGNFSDTIFHTPTACITGCTDSTAVSYNPWATQDDGSCGGTTCDPVTEHQVTMTIRLDNWPGETSWTMVTNAGPGVNTPQGTYNYNDVGITYTYTFCVSATAGFEFILNDSYGDGMAGNGSPGSAGEVVIYDCNGDTITYLSSGTWVDGLQNPVGVNMGGYPNGNVAYSGPQNGVACAGPPAVPGCLDPAYQEFNPLANVDDSSCTNLHIYGCIDSTAFNYDPSASINDLVPVCNYTLTIEDDAADGWGNSYLGVTQGNNQWTFTMGPGPYSQSFPLNLDSDKPITFYYFEIPDAQNPDPQQTAFQTFQNSFTLTNAYGVILLEEGTNPFANNGQGALQGFASPFWITYSAVPFCGDYCIPTILGCLDSTAFNYIQPVGDSLIDANTDDGSCVPVIIGCTNPLAFNYDSLANTDDGSCVSIIIGCMDTTAFNYNPSANTMDSASCIPVILGCMDDTMFNYNAAANTDDGSCIPVVFGCTDPNAFNYDSLANTNNGSCIPVILGCTDPSMFNYDPTANTDDSSCVPFIYGCTDPTQFNYDPSANTDNGSCIPFVYGCTDTAMYNYDPLANTDDGSCIPFIYGCTNPTMFNYDPSANTNNGTCIPYIYGCMDSTMWNYNSLANTDNGTCIPFIYGCTDNLAANWNPLANTNDNSCYYSPGCTDPNFLQFYTQGFVADFDDGSCVDSVVYGCMDNSMFNYDPLANIDNGSCIPFMYGCMDSTMFNYDPSANTDNGTCIPFIYGCTDSTAANYNAVANTENGTCYYAPGCTDPNFIQFWNQGFTADYDDGSCIDSVVYGCMDPTQFNYNPLANLADGSCIPYIYGCMDSTMWNYNPAANTDNGTCIPFIYGCTDATAANYNPLANTLDGSCYYNPGCTDPLYLQFWTQGYIADYDDGSCINLAVWGCMDPLAFNFDSTANIDDGSCVPKVFGCMDDGTIIDYDGDGLPALNYNPLANTEDGSCITKVFGCMDPTMFNYDPLANVDNGSCIPFIYGCMDTTMFNYNPLANTQPANACVPFIYGCMDDGQANDFDGDNLPAFNYCAPCNTNQVSATDVSDPCIPQIFGCTDSTAFNYDPLANVDNGTCIATVYGCTDDYDFQGYLYTTYPNYLPGFSTVVVYNYDPNANTDDGSCLYYDLNNVMGDSIPYWLNDSCYAWVVYDVDPYCLNNTWDAFCQSQYNYCEFGTPLDIEDMTRDQILVYPNPTRDFITIKAVERIDVDVYDMLGNCIIRKEEVQEIDLSQYTPGVYTLQIKYKEMIINHRVIKQ